MIRSNIATLNTDIAKLIKKAKGNGEAVAKAIALEIANRVIEKSPVDKGFLRGNWNLAVANIDSAEYPADRSGTSSISRATSKLGQFKAGNTIFVTNSLPYISKLEFGLYGEGGTSGKTINGFSSQAPHGFIRITHNEINTWAEREANKVIK